ncbi:thioredoxin [Desulfonispora thiosulfatigenes DSM 11270]|uniref:Thioredoxin n=1 Tax=Desulfonispora thiosulfatigenes DSM 11270 TaxID=656914 RepID=A0A1W1VQZ8_DESTI|nr:thioredoxin [Desulfonispora thiosulfatigenes]SMB95650.1 thioredoxin [Desulfonispora thiosulfatigenes DSM 11270]
MALTFTTAKFEEEVLKSSEPVLVDFWADWCGPCKMVGPVVEELAQDFEGKAKIGKLNVDENGSTAQTYGVMSIPTLILFKDGKELDRVVGFKDKEELAKFINKAL